MRERYLGPGLSPLQEEYSRQVDDLIRRAATSRRGRVVFFAGGAGSGRSFLLEGIARLPRERPKPIVIAGRFEHGRYIPGGQPQGNAIPAEVKDLITATLKAGSDLLGPVGPLIEQLVGASVAAYEWLRRERGRHEVSELLPRLLRAAAAAEPLVCLVDDMDHAEGAWWVSLLLSFAQEVNEELPLHRARRRHVSCEVARRGAVGEDVRL